MSTFATYNGLTTNNWQQLLCVGAQKLRITCSNAGVLLGFGNGTTVPVWESSDEPYLPLIGSIVRPFDAVRFMSLIAGAPAQLILIPALI
jgi:hypothetical protein